MAKPNMRAAWAAWALVFVLLLPTVVAGLAGAGNLQTFAEGDSVTLVSGDPSATATLSLPNPARVVAGSLKVSTVLDFETVPLPPAQSAWSSEVPGCATLERSPTPFEQVAFGPAELSQISAFDGVNWSTTLVTGKPALLLQIDISGVANPVAGPPLAANFTISARTDGAVRTDYQDLTVAAFASPPGSPGGWREAVLGQDPINASRVLGRMVEPPVITQGRFALLLILIVPRNDGARSLEVDHVEVELERPRLPLGPAVVVDGTSGQVWRFFSPAGLPAWFGRTTTFSSGQESTFLPSNGTGIDADTPATFVPLGSSIQSAFFRLAVQPSTDARAGASNGTRYAVGAGSTVATPGPVAVSEVPIDGHPTQGTVTLYNLSSHGVVDASHESLSTSQSVGNLSAFSQSVAQTFTIERDGTLEAISLNLADSTGHAVGPLLVEVRNTSAGSVGNLTLATGSVNLTAARLGGWLNFTLTPTLAVSAGQSYAIVMASPGAAANETWEWRGRQGGPLDPYAGGTALLSLESSGLGPWAPLGNVDMAFRVLLATPFDESEVGSLAVAGASGPVEWLPNYAGNATGWRFTVAGAAAGLVPTGGGLGRWEAAVANALPHGVEFEWDAFLAFELYPRSVELAIGDRLSFITLSELSAEKVVDARAELVAALAAGDYAVHPANGIEFAEFALRVRSSGPAGMSVYGVDLIYTAVLNVTGFAGALNSALAQVPPTASGANVSLRLAAGPEGGLALFDLNLTYSVPPRYFNQSAVSVPEGVVNFTVADLYQLFADDLDGFNLQYEVVSVIPTVASAAIYQSAVDANLTITMTVGEFSGPLFVTVRATDSSGLSTVSGPIAVDIVQVPDPPWVPAVLPDLVLLGTTGALDLSTYVLDNDTTSSALTVNVSSAFATVSGLNISFDYRGAPAILLMENVTIEISDGISRVVTTLKVLVNNAGRPILSLPAQVTVTRGHNATVALDPLVTDDRDPDGAMRWELLRIEGVGPTPGNGAARLLTNRSLVVSATAVGDLEVGLSVRDADGNLASGTIRVVVVANKDPVFAELDKTTWTLPKAGSIRVDLREHLSDPDDVFENLTFTVAWDNGSVVSADIENGTLVIVPVGSSEGRASVVVTAHDPAGAVAAATLFVTAQGDLVGGGEFTWGLIGLLGVTGVGGLLFLAMRRGKRERPSLGKMNREEAVVEGDEQAARAEGPAGLERTDEERLIDKLDEMVKEAGIEKVEVPPVTIVAPEGPLAASSVLLLYRDGRPIAWVSSRGPGEGDHEIAEELAAKLRDRLMKAKAGDRIEGEAVQLGAARFVYEGRSQMMLAAAVEAGADEQALRARMRDTLDRVFDRNAEALKRWEGGRSALKDIDEALEDAMRA